MLTEAEFFVEGKAAVGPHVEYLTYSAGCVAKLVGFGVNVYDVDVSLIDPAFEEDFVGSPLEYQQGDFTNGVKVRITSVDVTILKFQKGDVLVHGLGKFQ